MGQVSKALFKALYERDAMIDGFSDRNKELWGTNYYGVKCVPLNQISKDALIIVAKKNPGTVVKELKDKGFSRVYAYEGLLCLMMKAPINKERILL